MPEYEETEYAAKVVELFEKRDWTVYKEVEDVNTTRTVDIYAIKGPPAKPKHTWAIEVKTGFTLRLIEQAHFWRRHAHRSSVAFPASIESRTHAFASEVCTQFGIGMIEVVEGDYGPMFARELQYADHSSVINFPRLHEEQKHAIAGTDSRDERYTKLDATLDKVVDFVTEYPGIALEKVAERVDHHYSSLDSAYSSLLRAISSGRSAHLFVTWHNGNPFVHTTHEIQNDPTDTYD